MIKKRLLSLLLSALLLAALLPATAAGTDDFDIAHGVLLAYHGPGGAVTIPDGVRVIGEGAFYSRRNVTSVTMPDSVTEIAQGAFSGQAELKRVRFSQNLTAIGDSAFTNCTALQDAVLPHGLLSIGSEAFYNTNFTSFSIPATVNRLRQNFVYPIKWAWPQMGDFQVVGDALLIGYKGKGGDVVIPEGVRYVGEDAFAYGSWENGVHTGVPSDIRSVTIPGTVRQVQWNAFGNCTALERVSMAPGVVSVESAFNGMQLKAFEIPDTVTGLQITAVDEAGNVLPWAQPYRRGDFIVAGDGVLLGYTGAADEVTVPDGVKSVGRFGAADEGTALTVTLPDSVKRLEQGAFSGCKRLSGIALPDGLSEIGAGAFAQCEGLTGIRIPPAVTRIEADTFDSCRGLAQISLPGKLEYIGESAFYGCSRLSQLSLPGSLRTLGRAAFWYCYGIKHLTLPAGLQFVETGAVYTYSLKTLTVLGTDTVFGWDAIGTAVLQENGAYVLDREPPVVYTPAGAGVRAHAAVVGIPCRELPVAVSSPSKIVVDGKSVAFDAYAIEGSNYVKLRDLAMALTDSRTPIDIGWDGAAGAVTIQPYVTAYTSVGGELARGDGQSRTAYRSGSLFYFNGTLVNITAYVIGGNNYVMLRDLAILTDFGLDYDGATGTVTVDTGRGYRPGGDSAGIPLSGDA